jgi:hypothetical protein
VKATPTYISGTPSTPKVAPVLPVSSSIDDMVRRQFEICLVDILFWLPSTPAVALVSPVGLSEPSALPRTSVTESTSVDDMVRWQFEICLVDILCWPDFDVVSLRSKFSFPPSLVAPVSNIQEAPEDGDGDSESDDFYCSLAVALPRGPSTRAELHR